MRDIAFQTPTSDRIDALFGTPVTATSVYGAVEGAVLSDSTAPYVGRGNLCSGNDDTCGAKRVTGEQLCAGHLRALRKELGMPYTKGPLSLDGTAEGEVAAVEDDG